jgi:hypothetical protein
MSAEQLTLEMAKRLEDNLKEFQERCRKADYPGDNIIHFGHMICALQCDIKMVIENLEKEKTRIDIVKIAILESRNLKKEMSMRELVVEALLDEECGVTYQYNASDLANMSDKELLVLYISIMS